MARKNVIITIGIILALLIISVIVLVKWNSGNVDDIDDASILDDSIDSDFDVVDSEPVNLGELDEFDSIESDFDEVDDGLIEFGELI